MAQGLKIWEGFFYSATPGLKCLIQMGEIFAMTFLGMHGCLKLTGRKLCVSTFKQHLKSWGFHGPQNCAHKLLNNNLTWNLCLVFQSHENVTADNHQKSCGSPDAKPMILTTNIKKECPAHCISHQQFGENDVKINANDGTLDIIKPGNIFKVCNPEIIFKKLTN